MKKAYIPPKIYLDTFEVDAAIALNCADKAAQDEIYQMAWEQWEEGNSEEESFDDFYKSIFESFGGDPNDTVCYYTHSNAAFGS